MGCATRPRTVGRWLERLGISRRRDLDPTSMPDRVPGVIGPLPGAHGAHGCQEGRSDPHRGRVARSRTGHRRGQGVQEGRAPSGLHLPAFHDRRVLPPGPAKALDDERATTAIAFFARAFFEVNGIARITRLVTDNGAAYRSTAFNDAVRDLMERHQYTRPYTPRHNGIVERYNRFLAKGVPLHPSIHLRGTAKRRAGPMVRPLHLPPTPHRHGGQPTRQSRPHPHKQCHTLTPRRLHRPQL